MIELLHFIRDTDLFIYYVFCYGILILGCGFILSFLAMCFCAVLYKVEVFKVEKQNKKNKVNIGIYEGKTGTGMSIPYWLEMYEKEKQEVENND